jgi:hypothetical protein
MQHLAFRCEPYSAGDWFFPFDQTPKVVQVCERPHGQIDFPKLERVFRLPGHPVACLGIRREFVLTHISESEYEPREVETMAKDYSVDGLYRMGRTYPNGDGPKAAPSKANVAPKWETDLKNNSARVQFREDQRDVGYANNTREKWLIGKGSYPNFRKGE